jgi:hypothetical protein
LFGQSKKGHVVFHSPIPLPLFFILFLTNTNNNKGVESGLQIIEKNIFRLLFIEKEKENKKIFSAILLKIKENRKKN